MLVFAMMLVSYFLGILTILTLIAYIAEAEADRQP